MILGTHHLLKPKISIVLPYLNTEHSIAEPIQSCLNQTFIDFELIIIGNSLTDSTELVIKQYMDLDNRIKFFPYKIIIDSHEVDIPNKTNIDGIKTATYGKANNIKNNQLATILNTGFKYARGEYFTWIMGNNIFHPTALEKMYQILDTTNEVGLVYSGYTIINYNGNIKYRLYQEDPKYLVIKNCVGLCFMYRSVLAKQIGEYDENFFLLVDYDYWLRMSLITKLYHLKESLCVYRKSNQTNTIDRKQQSFQEQIILKEKFKDRFILDDSLKLINELHICLISKKTLTAYLRFLLIILINPIIALSYILKHLKSKY